MLRKCLTLALVSFGLVTAAAADSRARIVRLSYVEGDVELDRRDDRGFQRAFLNMPVIESARVWTRNDARAEIEMEDGSTIRLTPDSIVEFRELNLRGDGGRVTLMEIQEGTAYVNLKRRGGDDFRVLVNNEQITPNKDARFRVEADRAQLRLAVFRGDLNVQRANGERMDVRKNETLEVDFNELGRYYLSKGVAEAAFDYWDREREDDRARYAQQQSYRSYPVAYSYGYYDLNRYGTFFDVGGYGSLWRPYGVAFGWDPFADGSWVYYPGYGYTWVSAYPWGWTPYRYGSWVFVGGRGWCWRPSHNYNTWVNVVNVYNGPTGYRPPRPPRTIVATVVPVGNGASSTWTQAQDVVGRGPSGRRMPVVDDRPIVDRNGGITVTGGGSGNALTGGSTSLSRPVREHRDGNVINNDVIESRRPVTVDANNGVIVDSTAGVGIRPERGTRGPTTLPSVDRTPAPTATGDSDYDGVQYRSRAPGSPQSDASVGRERRPLRDTNADAPGAPGRGWSAPPQQQPAAAPTPSEPPAVRPERPSRNGVSPQPPAPVSGPRMERPVRSERISPPFSYERQSSPPPARTFSPPSSAPAHASPPASRESRGSRPH